ncbi:MAG: phosphoenolpyruvate-utilizing N-terminal domain-containing protein, partial [Isosphaeraceae bacterium]
MNPRDEAASPQFAREGKSGPGSGRNDPDWTVQVRVKHRNVGMPPSAIPNSTDRSLSASPSMKVLRGLAVSPGIAIGPVVVVDRRGFRLPPRKIDPTAVAAEVGRLDRGLEAAGHEAEVAGLDARDRLGPQYADILSAHARMIADPTLRADAGWRIKQEQISAEHAVVEVLEAHAARLEQLSDSYLAARAADVRDIEARILSQLIGRRASSVPEGLSTPVLILAQDLSPSEAAGLDPKSILGFATEAGGQASHTAIVAAALEI